MERLGNNPEKKPERAIDRIKRVGGQFLERYGESLKHGDYYVAGGPGHMFVIPVAEKDPEATTERLARPEDRFDIFGDDEY